MSITIKKMCFGLAV